MSACTTKPCKASNDVNTMYKRSLCLVSACLSVTTIYSIYSLQVTTMCLPIHVEASLTTTLSMVYYYPLSVPRAFIVSSTTYVSTYPSFTTFSHSPHIHPCAGTLYPIQVPYVPYPEVMHRSYHSQPPTYHIWVQDSNLPITPYISLGGDPLDHIQIPG